MPNYTNTGANTAQTNPTRNDRVVANGFRGAGIAGTIRQEMRDVGTDDAVDAVRYNHELRPDGVYATVDARITRNADTDGEIRWEIPVTPPTMHRAVPREFQYMLSAIAYLLFKKGGINPGEYQTLTALNELSFDELLAYIIQVADSPAE